MDLTSWLEMQRVGDATRANYRSVLRKAEAQIGKPLSELTVRDAKNLSAHYHELAGGPQVAKVGPQERRHPVRKGHGGRRGTHRAHRLGCARRGELHEASESGRPRSVVRGGGAEAPYRVRLAPDASTCCGGGGHQQEDLESPFPT